MKFSRIAALIALMLLVATMAMAQTTATLSGTVTSEGTALPGVLVTATSPMMQGPRTAVSDMNGKYNFPALPPGAFKVQFELEGMQPVTKSVNVALNTNARADADLALTTVSEAITVTAAAPAVLETPQVASNFSDSVVEALPMAKNVINVASLAPGVNTNTASAGQLQISGSPGYDNLVMINGVSITENVRSQAMDLFIEDAIQETTVLTGAVSAEWGGFTGGVVNSITKSGGNQFTGSLRNRLTNPSWANERPGETITIDKVNNVYQGTLGGYIMQDRLWFFLAGHDAETSTANQLLRTNIPYATTNTDTRYEYKLTGQLGQNHSLVASYFDRDRETSNASFSNIYDTRSLYNRMDPETLTSAHYNGVITSNFLLEGHYSKRTWDVSVGGGSMYTDLIQGTLMLNRGESNYRFNSPTFCGVCDKETRNNDGITLKGTYFLGTENFGSHNLIGGYQTFSEMRHANNYQSGSNFRVYVTNVIRASGTTPLLSQDGQLYPVISKSNSFIRWTPIFSVSNAENDMGTDSIFINDRWDLNGNWSFNVGLRYDKNDAVDGDGNVASDDAAISPRFTAMFDPKGDGRHRISASYNRYVSRVLEGPGTAMESSGSPATIDFYYQGPDINPTGTPQGSLLTAQQALAQVFSWFNAQCLNGDTTKCGTSNTGLLRGNPSIPGVSTIFEKTLASPSVDELQLGYGLQIRPNAYVKADVIYRNWTDFFAYRIDQSTPRATDSNGLTTDVAIAENIEDGVAREYRALQFQGSWTPTVMQSRMNLGLNYTLAFLEGNDEQESSVSGTVGNSPGAIYYPELLNYENYQPEGYLTYDQRHRLKAWVGYDLPLPEVLGRFNVSLLQNFDSGTAYSAVGVINLEDYTGAVDTSKTNYSGAPVEGQYYFSDRGEFRLPDVSRTDIGLNWNRKIFRSFEVFGEAEMLNIFGNEAATAVNATVYTYASGASNCPGCKAFNPFTENPVEGTHWKKGPNFGKPTAASSYQLARTYRFSLGFRF
ncbi:MAG: TonB-dependent receptor [Thermoanaerobaculia bacterium]